MYEHAHDFSGQYLQCISKIKPPVFQFSAFSASAWCLGHAKHRNCSQMICCTLAASRSKGEVLICNTARVWRGWRGALRWKSTRGGIGDRISTARFCQVPATICLRLGAFEAASSCLQGGGQLWTSISLHLEGVWVGHDWVHMENGGLLAQEFKLRRSWPAHLSFALPKGLAHACYLLPVLQRKMQSLLLSCLSFAFLRADAWSATFRWAPAGDSITPGCRSFCRVSRHPGSLMLLRMCSEV